MKTTSWEQIKAILHGIGASLASGVKHALEIAEEAAKAATNARSVANEARNTANGKLDAKNPVATGSFSLSRSQGSAVGGNSFAAGTNVSATAYDTFAVGNNTEATVHAAHAEGSQTKAAGVAAHAEGSFTKASEASAHAEGESTEAKGLAAHSEGMNTIARGRCQHVQGRFNIEDTDERYAHIVGNGTGYNEARANAHTLGWDGKAWYQGGVYVGGTSQDDADRLATVKELEAAAGAATLPDYWQAHIDERAAQIRAAMAAAGANKSAFLWYSDAHWTYSFRKSPMLLKALSRRTPITRTIFCGDVIGAEGDEQTMAYLWDWREALDGLENHHSVPGNHDDGNETDNRYDDGYIYAYLLAAEETADVVRGESGLYYYVDAPAERTRYLYLDTATAEGNILNDAAQQAWLREALKSAPDGWHIIAAAHIWRTYDASYADNGWGYGAKIVLDTLDAYNARTGEFASCTGRVELCVGGHTHMDADFVSDGGIPVILTECDSRHVRSGLDCTEGTITEAAVSAVIADYANGKVSVIRVGRGEGRSVNLAKRIEPAGYKNQLPISTDTDGTVYNGTGYKENTRISTTTQAETEAEGWCLTGCIPATKGDVIRLKNVTFLDIHNESGTDRTQVYFYTAGYVYDGNTDAYSPESPMSEAWNAVYAANGDIVQFTIPTVYSSSMAFIRICAKRLDQNSVITVNEEID